MNFLSSLKNYFSLAEVRDMCFELDVEYENLAGEGKGSKARELIAYSGVTEACQVRSSWKMLMTPLKSYGNHCKASLSHFQFDKGPTSM